MIADPLTNAMNVDRLVSTFTTGYFDVKPTAESVMIKEKNRIARETLKKQSA